MERDVEYVIVSGGDAGELNPSGPNDEAPDTAENDSLGIEDVWVVKNSNDHSLGLVLNNEKVVTHVICGGVSHGKLRRGDRLLSVDGQELAPLVKEQMASALNKTGQLHFKIRRDAENGYLQQQQQQQQLQQQQKKYLRAPYAYDPQKDPLHPCTTAGLAFQRGDIIEVLSEDSDWWQGTIVNGENAKVGLFPSPKFQLKNLSKSMRGHQVDFERQGLLQPQPGRPRPLVLLGAPGLGRYELLLRLIQRDRELFAPPVAHTTRPPRAEERNGVHYWFCSEQDFRRSQAKFLETWQSGSHSYGLSIDSVTDIINSGKVCVLPLQPSSLEAMRAHEPFLRPFSVFIRPPAENVRTSLWQSSTLRQGDPPSAEDLRRIAQQSVDMEFDFGHLFDEFVDLKDYEKDVDDLVQLVGSLCQQPKWVPLAWLQD